MSRLPPAEKLPLAVRKNVRDEWESKKDDLTKELSDILGTPWTIGINPLAVYPYAEEDSYAKNSLGSALNDYVSGATYQLKQFVNSFGEDGKDEINTIASSHVLTIDVDVEDKVYYCGVQVNDARQLVILFRKDKLGTNVNDALSSANLTKALNEAPPTSDDKALSYISRENIASGYKSKIGETEAKLQKIFGKSITVDPNFEETFTKLKASKNASDGWDGSLGDRIRWYFEGLAYQLVNAKFDSDDMLQEALVEAVEKDTVKFRIVEKTKRTYGETVIEDGILYLQATPEKFGTNTNDAGEHIIDLL